MPSRLPLILSSIALLVAVFGATPVGRAAGELARAVVPFAQKAGYAKTSGFAKYAGDATTVNGIKAARVPKPGLLVPLGPDGKFPSSVGEAGAVGPRGATGPQGTAGKNGATNVTIVTATSTGAGNTSADANCPTGTVATGGGWYGTTPIISRPLPATISSGQTPTGWTASLTYSASAQTIYVYAICASP